MSTTGVRKARSAHKPASETRAVSTPAPQYSEIVKNLPVGLAILHFEDVYNPLSYQIVDLNEAAAELMGATVDKLRGRTLGEFPKVLQSLDISNCGEDILKGTRVIDLGEFEYGDDDIRHGVYSVRLFPLSCDTIGAVIENVTEQRVAEIAVRESEERFRLLVESVREYAIFYLDVQGRIVSWNAGAERLKGYRADEVVGKHFSMFYPDEEQREKVEQRLTEAAEKGQSEEEGWLTRKDGSRFWAHVVISALRDPEGNLQGFTKLTRDVTERREKVEALREAKEQLELRVEQRTADLERVNDELRLEIAERGRAEERLKDSRDRLRALAARLQRVREEERIRIAREIHDELGQACTALKMDMALIGRRISKKQTEISNRIKSAMGLADGLIHSMRRIASELRPRALDDLGLATALEWQAQEFESRTKIMCCVSLPDEPLELDPDYSTAIFRIFQETLTNVARHSEATRVDARLWKEGPELVLQVQDNGKGFDSEMVKARKSLGLIGMQERAILLNGTVRVEGSVGKGTTVTVRVPIS